MKEKELVTKETSFVTIDPNLNQEELDRREVDYNSMTDLHFKQNREMYLFNPVKIKIKDREYKLQFNYCAKPLCKWFGTEQVRFRPEGNRDDFKYTPVNSGDEKTLRCNEFEDGETIGYIAEPKYSKIFSNWSIATEIKRLVDINSVVVKEYIFHEDTCIHLVRNQLRKTNFYST